jgi:polysaccharide deacetylase family protein (PEP-CTERM system associated)
MATSLVHCLTFDIEEHFQVSAFESPMRRRHWENFESRVERNTEKLLELLRMRDIRATFFVLGWIAERHRRLVKRIVDEGHEVASHGYAHELVTLQTPSRFQEDIRKTKMMLEDLIGAPVLGYRAPSFTMTRETTWAFRILAEEGYVYDSSVFPVWHPTYGMPGAKTTRHVVLTDAGPIWEFPLSTAKIAGLRLPIAGGGYFRLFPYGLTRKLLKRVKAGGQGLVMYLHPWELDPDQPRMHGPLLSRFRHYVNLEKTEGRLIRLLEDFRFAPIRDAVPSMTKLKQTKTVIVQRSASPGGNGVRIDIGKPSTVHGQRSAVSGPRSTVKQTASCKLTAEDLGIIRIGDLRNV